MVGSSVLAVHGIRENKDIDIIVKSCYRRKYESTDVVPLSESVEIASVNWAKSKKREAIADDEVIDNSKYHFVYKGFKFVTLDLLLERKESDSREKDIADVELIRHYLQK